MEAGLDRPYSEGREGQAARRQLRAHRPHEPPQQARREADPRQATSLRGAEPTGPSRAGRLPAGAVPVGGGQQVQDGWNLPKSRGRHTPDGACSQKHVLLAFDFARAYDTVDHQLLMVRLMELGIPRCHYNWIWQFLRDRRARLEFQSATSGERVLQGGPASGQCPVPGLVSVMGRTPRRRTAVDPRHDCILLGDEIAALCSGNNIQIARDRAHRAADSLVQWAQASKMAEAGQKTQALVLSQWSRDAVNCTVQWSFS